LLAQERPVVLGGDYNIIPEPEDVHDPEGWRNDALFRLESRKAYRALLHLGLTEAYRALHPAVPGQPPAYTFWDYQAGCWPRNLGLRIDHFLLSPQAADRLESCTIDRQPRGLDRASDHTPVVLVLRD
jgi:exodeoxyribonuclease-3